MCARCYCVMYTVLYVELFMMRYWCCYIFFFQAEDGIRDLVRSRGLGDVYKRQGFPLESITQRSERNTLMKAILQFLAR